MMEGDWVGVALSVLGIGIAAGVALWIRHRRKKETGPPPYQP